MGSTGRGRRIRDASHRLLPSLTMSTPALRTVVRTVLGALAASLVAWSPVPSAHAERVKPELFGMDLIQQTAPTAPLGPTPTMRLIVNWSKVEVSPGTYDWTGLDARVAMARANQSRPLFTLFGTPSFHAVHRMPGAPIYVQPPRLRAYRAFVRALVERYGAGVDYQVWAEMNVPGNYVGTPRNMAKMAWIMSREVDGRAPQARVVAPQGPIRYRENRDWFRKFWEMRVKGKRVGKWVDVATLSGFPLPRWGPEKAIRLVKWLRRITADQGFTGPIWIVEINYDVLGFKPTARISMDQQVANVVKTYVLNASIGTQRVYWHYWSKPVAHMNTAMLTADGEVAPSGKAFGVIQPWLIGTKAKGCTITRNGDLYSCLFVTRESERRVLWSVSGYERRVLVPAGTTTVSAPDGTVRPMGSAKRVKVGLVPVMIESPRERDRQGPRAR